MTRALRRCRRCCTEKGLAEFDEHPQGPDGYFKWCRTCRKIPTEYRVYVIELSDSAGARRNTPYCHLYVGQTAAQVECRFWQHRNGMHSATIVKNHGLRLRYDLFDQLQKLSSRDEALALEEETALRLEQAGFTVHQN